MILIVKEKKMQIFNIKNYNKSIQKFFRINKSKIKKKFKLMIESFLILIITMTQQFVKVHIIIITLNKDQIKYMKNIIIFMKKIDALQFNYKYIKIKQ